MFLSIQTTTGSRIEQARTQLGLTGPQLARRIGVKGKTLENWENDRSEPRGDKLVKLAGILQVPLIWLLTGNTPSDAGRRLPIGSETATISQKLERAIALQHDLAALLLDISADLARVQKAIDLDGEMAA